MAQIDEKPKLGIRPNFENVKNGYPKMIISLAQFEVQNLGLVFLLFFCSQLTQKLLPGGELNPGLPRDRRGYLPLYYRGTKALNSLFMKFWRPITNTAH